MKAPHGRKAVTAFYGNPTSHGGLDSEWYRQNVSWVKLPYPMRYAGNLARKITHVWIHNAIAVELVEALTEAYNYARVMVKKRDGWDKSTAYYDRKTLKLLRDLRLDRFGGSFNYRAIRGSSALSLHSYGAAIDIDPVHNGLGAKPTIPMWFVLIFEKRGWRWGGRFRRRDSMHMQFATGC